MESIFEIGQKVEWTVGNVKSSGVVLEQKGEVTEVVSHYIGGRPSVQNLEVQTILLTKV